jgi:threonine dehydratase
VSTEIDRRAIERTHSLISPYIRTTPVLETTGADFGLAAFPLTFKLELLQHAGSFKTRGAFANLLTRAVPPAGVVAASGGNHGAAVAYAAMRRGVRARIFVPTVSSPAKIARIRHYGADLVVTGDRYADALAASQAWAGPARWPCTPSIRRKPCSGRGRSPSSSRGRRRPSTRCWCRSAAAGSSAASPPGAAAGRR